MSRPTKKSNTTRGAVHPMQPVGWDGSGVIRFKANEIVRALLDCASAHGLDINAIGRGAFSRSDRDQFLQLIGYSVSGYYGSPATQAAGDRAVAQLLKRCPKQPRARRRATP